MGSHHQPARMVAPVCVFTLLAVAAASPDPEASALFLGPRHHQHSGHLGYYRPRGFYYGKRSSDAGPDAAAEADALFFGHRHHYSHSQLGYYRTHGYHYGKRSGDASPDADALFFGHRHHHGH